MKTSPKVLFLYLVIASLLGIISFQQHLLEERGRLTVECYKRTRQSIQLSEQCTRALVDCSSTMSTAVPALSIWTDYMDLGAQTPFDVIKYQAIGGSNE
jgi:hypothetical protein